MSERKSAIIHCAVGALVLLAAGAARAQSGADILTYKGPNRQERLIEGAKKEGKLVFYSAMIVNQALRPVTVAFQKKYPFVSMTYWRGDSEELIAKFSAESRANNIVGDVLGGGGVGELAVEGGFAQPMWSPEFAAIPEPRRDPQNMWAPTRMNYFGLAYNTKLVSAEEAPKTYEDLLKPRWKGKMAWVVGTASAAPLFITNLRVAWGEDKALAYLKQLAQQKIINYGSGTARSLVDRVVAGEYEVALQIYAHHPLISAKKGAPVAARMLDPTVSTSGTIVIPKGAPHIHAAMLLVDYLLSPEGQKTLAKAQYLPVRSDVDPLDYIAPIVPAKAGVHENAISPAKLIKMAPASDKIIQEYFR
jgi:ABC-type Fe3+ transport system substrate-binding protein